MGNLRQMVHLNAKLLVPFLCDAPHVAGRIACDLRLGFLGMSQLWKFKADLFKLTLPPGSVA